MSCIERTVPLYTSIVATLVALLLSLFVAGTAHAESDKECAPAAQEGLTEHAAGDYLETKLALLLDADDADAMMLAWSLLQMHQDPEAVPLLQRALGMHPEDTLVNLALRSHCRLDSNAALCSQVAEAPRLIEPDNAYSALFGLSRASSPDQMDAALEHLATAPRFESFWLLAVRRLDSAIQQLHRDHPVVAESCQGLVSEVRKDLEMASLMRSGDCFSADSATVASAASQMTTPSWYMVATACRDDALLIDGRTQRCRAAMSRIWAEEQTGLIDDSIAIGILDGLAEDGDEKQALAEQREELQSLQQVMMVDIDQQEAQGRRFWQLMVSQSLGETQALRILQSEWAHIGQR